MQKPLTKKQFETLEFIKKFIVRNGYAPSLDDICRRFKLNSSSSAHDRVKHLVIKDYIFRYPQKSRAMVVLDLTNHRQKG